MEILIGRWSFFNGELFMEETAAEVAATGRRGGESARNEEAITTSFWDGGRGRDDTVEREVHGICVS